ncbi:MAG TPA: LemA family protein [Gemmatimonadaceae bacterium]|nr:LemA family protein [Gemmatimonadaceae bacterium]
MHLRRMLALTLAVPLLAGCGYNRIQELDEGVNRAKQDISVQLQRRADLVPNLVETVRGYAAHEEAIFTSVAEARAGLAGAVQTGDPAQMAAANQQLTGALGRLLAIAEAYPQLRADQSFIRLQDELAGTENRIAVSRQDYNERVATYNTYIRRFPTTLTARAIGAQQREYFEVTDEAARTAPAVDFSKTPSP